MTTDSKAKVKPKKRLVPIPAKRRSFKDAMAATNKQFAETLARLAK